MGDLVWTGVRFSAPPPKKPSRSGKPACFFVITAVLENRTPPALRGPRNVPVARFAEQAPRMRAAHTPFDSPRLHQNLPGRFGNGPAFLLLHVANQCAENRGSQNLLRPLRAENGSPDRFRGAARRRANSRASTRIYQAGSATDLPFCCCGRPCEPSCRKM